MNTNDTKTKKELLKSLLQDAISTGRTYASSGDLSPNLWHAERDRQVDVLLKRAEEEGLLAESREQAPASERLTAICRRLEDAKPTERTPKVVMELRSLIQEIINEQMIMRRSRKESLLRVQQWVLGVHLGVDDAVPESALEVVDQFLFKLTLQDMKRNAARENKQ